MAFQPVLDFSDRARFPNFNDTPTTEGSHVLLGTYKENMSITRPTYILEDRDKQSFAVTFMIANDSPVRPKFKKGAAVAVCGLARQEPNAAAGETKKSACIRVRAGEETRVVGLGVSLDRILATSAADPLTASCAACGKPEGKTEGMKRCTSCGWVKYCGKECQIEGWNTKGHKGDCKAFRLLQAALK
ncbi:hypothetical protein CFIMG_007715RA00001 [Ceratocystis fimbriata CBS 114723]|uniref:MYND-type domain-containing protein n=1 Tax=Ceratocystis fimbriata CBS 114723 TaxID=1035309 RepID=A0A2C5WV66_9PEZI|nr:hypothetical protein CFIMG_007715RA00001 [Ceratocystis fimbriata CBS 114723]